MLLKLQNVVGLTMGKAYLQIHASSAVVIVVEYSLLQVNKLIGFFFCEERQAIKRSQFNLGSNYNNAKVYFCKMIKLAEHFRHSICQSSMFVRISSEDSITLRQDLGLQHESEEDVKSVLFFQSYIDFHSFCYKDFQFNRKITIPLEAQLQVACSYSHTVTLQIRWK